jgi:quercetin dioxygenase-like cupin family protein
MNMSEFAAKLEQDGFAEIETKMLQPRPVNDEHEHPYLIRGMVLEGEFIVTCAGQPRGYLSGEIFEVAAGVKHSEAVGHSGARILVGRKY